VNSTLLEWKAVSRPVHTGLFATGLILIGILWEIAGRQHWLGVMLPALSDIFDAFKRPRDQQILLDAITSTAPNIVAGFVLGAAIAVTAALLEVLLPALEGALQRIALMASVLPLIALAPLLVTTLGVDRVPAAVAAITAFYPIFVASSSGFHYSPRELTDTLYSLGGRRVDVFLHVRLPGAVLMIVDSLKLAAPAAVFGALFGEWFGTDRGLGVLLVTTMQNDQVLLLWLAALTATGLAVVAMIVFSALGALVARKYQ
jgi:ABC-type nitrate/sulfonate/bicarbonate transport system permease component